VLFQQGDYYGRTVNLASRIAEYARPGEVLVSQEVVDASAGSR
jgi:class 3 adenylate cyclase